MQMLNITWGKKSALFVLKKNMTKNYGLRTKFLLACGKIGLIFLNKTGNSVFVCVCACQLFYIGFT